MIHLLYATPYEQEMLTLSREILRDTGSKYQIMSPAVAVLECSDDPADIELCKDARTRMQVIESRFPKVVPQSEIDAEELDRFHGYWQSAAAMIVGVLAGVAIIAWVLP